MKLNQKAQQIIEYLLIVAAVAAGAIGVAGPKGPMGKAVQRSLNSAFETIYQDYMWTMGVPTACDQPCGLGYQTRDVYCKDEMGEKVADAFCLAKGPKPPKKVTCIIKDCGNYAWWGSGWSECSVPCGDGMQYQNQVVCKDNNGTGATVPDALCDPSTNPKPTSQTCHIKDCYTWKASGTCSGLCSAPCGPGFCDQGVSCLDNMTGQLVDNSKCPALTAPVQLVCDTSQSCNYQWLTGQWSACNKTCEDYAGALAFSTRNVTCIRRVDNVDLGSSPPAGTCDGATKPADRQDCNLNPCNTWKAVGGWSDCSKDCGGGKKTATIKCVDPGGTQLDDTACSHSGAKPEALQDCNMGACTWDWGVYGACVHPQNCGTDGNQTRDVFCYQYGFPGVHLKVQWCGAPAGPPGGTTLNCAPTDVSCTQNNECTETSGCCGNGRCDNTFPAAVGYTETCGTCSNSSGVFDCGGCPCPGGMIANSNKCNGTWENVSDPAPATWKYHDTQSQCNAAGKCEAYCDPYYHYSVGNGSCVLYSCTGSPADHSDICTGQDTNLTVDTPYNLSPTNSCDTSTKCQTACKSGYHSAGAICADNVCAANPNPHSVMCSGQTANPPNNPQSVSLSPAGCDGTTPCQAMCDQANNYYWDGTQCSIRRNAVCDNTTKWGCSPGTVNEGSKDPGACGGHASWNCDGVNGGNPAIGCQIDNPKCPVRGACDNSTLWGCANGTTVNEASKNRGTCGNYASWFCDGLYGGDPSGLCFLINTFDCDCPAIPSGMQTWNTNCSANHGEFPSSPPTTSILIQDTDGPWTGSYSYHCTSSGTWLNSSDCSCASNCSSLTCGQTDVCGHLCNSSDGCIPITCFINYAGNWNSSGGNPTGPCQWPFSGKTDYNVGEILEMRDDSGPWTGIFRYTCTGSGWVQFGTPTCTCASNCSSLPCGQTDVCGHLCNSSDGCIPITCFINYAGNWNSSGGNASGPCQWPFSGKTDYNVGEILEMRDDSGPWTGIFRYTCTGSGWVQFGTPTCTCASNCSSLPCGQTDVCGHTCVASDGCIDKCPSITVSPSWGSSNQCTATITLPEKSAGGTGTPTVTVPDTTGPWTGSINYVCLSGSGSWQVSPGTESCSCASNCANLQCGLTDTCSNKCTSGSGCYQYSGTGCPSPAACPNGWIKQGSDLCAGQPMYRYYCKGISGYAGCYFNAGTWSCGGTGSNAMCSIDICTSGGSVLLTQGLDYSWRFK